MAAHELNESNSVTPEQFSALQQEVAALRAAAQHKAAQRTRRQRIAGMAVFAALLGAGIGLSPAKGFSSPGSAAACGAEHSTSLYCVAAGEPARASEINSNFETLADGVDMTNSSVSQLSGRVDAVSKKLDTHTHPSTLSYSDTFLQYGGSGTLGGFTSANSVCFVGRIDVFGVPSSGVKCQAYLQGSQWMGYTEGPVFCNIRCLKW